MEESIPEVKLTHCEKRGSKYINKWNEWPFNLYKGIPKFIGWGFSKLFHGFPKEKELNKMLPIFVPYFVRDVDKYPEEKSVIKATWLGHASVLIEMDGFRILCDPIFSYRCGPVIGIARYREPPCLVKDLPKIDAVVVSHNHYDHMDHYSIKELSEIQPDIKWIVPEGDRKNIEDMIGTGSKVVEMLWWDEHVLSNEEDQTKLTIAFTPTQHWSNRGVLDLFKSLWGSYAFIGSKQRFWFGGDTGYCGAFKEIGEKYGPFDGAAIPIGAYEPRELLQFQHVSPDEAVRIHQDIKSRISFGIHWGTFFLTRESYLDPKVTLDKIVNGLEEKINFFAINHGETLIVREKDYEVVSSNETLSDKEVTPTKRPDPCNAELFDPTSD